MRTALIFSLLQVAVLGAAETQVHRWVDEEGVTHFSASPPEDARPFETMILETEVGVAPRPSRRYTAPRPPPSRPVVRDDGAAEARCAAWLDELRAITDRRRRGHTAAESVRLRERSSELNRLRQREC